MTKQSLRMQQLSQGAIPKLLWQFYVPAFMGVIINALYNIVDRIFIGQYVGSTALAGLSAVFPIMTIISAFGMMVGIGAGARVSINMGKGDLERAALVVGNAIVLTLITAVFLTTNGYLLSDSILSFFGVSAQTHQFASDYLDIIIGGILFHIMGYSMCDLIRAEGNPRIAMLFLLVSASTNIVLDYIFVVHLHLGVKGAAYATIISQAVLATIALRHFSTPNAIVRVKRTDLRLTKKIVWYILTIGFAPFCIQMASSAVSGFYNIQLVKYANDTAIGAMGIVISVTLLLIMSLMAITMANQPIIGFNFGAQRFDRVKQTWLLSMAFASLISLVGFAVVQFFPEQIVGLFNKDDEELMRIATHGLRTFLLAVPVVGFQVVTTSFYQSIGKPAIATMLSLLRQVFILIPLIYFLPLQFGLEGIWMASPVSDVLSACICLFFVLREMRKLNQAIEAGPEGTAVYSV